MFKPRVLDAVGAIGNYVAGDSDVRLNYEEIADVLFDRGFSTAEINDAFRWIEQNTLGPRKASAAEKEYLPEILKQPLRRLNPMEAAKIDSKAFGMLLDYYNRGLIDSFLMEEIIERALNSDRSIVGQKELRRITALTLFNRFQFEWRELLRNSNTLVH